MAFKQRHTFNVLLHEPGSGGVTAFNWFEEQTNAAENNISESIADSTTDGLVAYALDVSQVKNFAMWSDQIILVETNDGTTPADTISLSANQPYLWSAASYEPFLFGTDITALYVTNSSGSAATLNIRCVLDPTV